MKTFFDVLVCSDSRQTLEYLSRRLGEALGALSNPAVWACTEWADLATPVLATALARDSEVRRAFFRPRLFAARESNARPACPAKKAFSN